MSRLMTKAEFDRLDENDRSMIAAGFQDSEDLNLPLDPKDQAIADRDAIIAVQHQQLVNAAAAIEGATALIQQCVEGRSSSV